MNMPEGIKLSDQLYPATGDKILSQAEYIHDSEWEGEYKDLQSINKDLNDSIADVSTTLNNKIEDYKVTAGPGLVQYKIENGETIPTDNGGKIAICDTVFAYLEDPDNEYPGIIRGALRGDVDHDGKVSISDVTSLINLLLNDDIDKNILLYFEVKDIENISDNDENTFTSTLGLTSNLYLLEIEKFSLDKNTTISKENTPLEKSVILCNKALESNDSTIENQEESESLSTTSIDFSKGSALEAKIIGYRVDLNSELQELTTHKVKFEEGFIDDTFNWYLTKIDEVDSLKINIQIYIIDPNGLLNAINIEDDTAIKIGAVTELINHLLKNKEWTTDNNFYLKYFGDSYGLYVNNKIEPVYPGIIYLAYDKETDKVKYFISNLVNHRNTTSYSLIPLYITPYNIDIYDLKKWLQATVLIDKENKSTSLSSAGDASINDPNLNSRITASFIKYSDSNIKDIIENMNLNDDITDFVNAFGIVNKGGLPLTYNKNINDGPVIKVPVYLWDLSNAEIVNTPGPNNQEYLEHLLYNNLFDNVRIKVELSDNSEIKLVNNLGEEVEYVIFDNINNAYPFIILNLKYKLPELLYNNSTLSTSIRLVELSSVDDKVFIPVGSILDLNLVPNIN